MYALVLSVVMLVAVLYLCGGSGLVVVGFIAVSVCLALEGLYRDASTLTVLGYLAVAVVLLTAVAVSHLIGHLRAHFRAHTRARARSRVGPGSCNDRPTL